MVSPDYAQAKRLSETGAFKTIPLSCELYADSVTPLTVLRRLKNVSKHCFLLESVDKSHKWGRYTFLGFDPVMEITCTQGKLAIRAGSSVPSEAKNHKLLET
jgi:anthranilate synthase component 1